MAEYIEREALIAEIEENIKTYWNEGSGGYWLAEDALNESVKTAPTADVVPKSEVEWLYKQVDCLSQEVMYNDDIAKMKVDEAKAEVAREIFEEIEKIVVKVRVEDTKNFVLSEKQFAELKKEYTDQKQCPNCRYFVGCECFDGKTCDEYEEKKV